MRAEATCCPVKRTVYVLVAVGLGVASAALDDADASELFYSQRDKFCFTNVNKFCFVGSSVRLPIKCNSTVAAAVLIEQTGDGKKTLRITSPHVRVEDGVRISIDGEWPESLVFQKCVPNGCTADDEASPELVDQLKNGTMLPGRQ